MKGRLRRNDFCEFYSLCFSINQNQPTCNLVLEQSEPAAVNVDDLPGDKFPRLRGEQDRSAYQVVGRTPSGKWGLCKDPLIEILIGPKRLGFAAGISCHGTNLIAYTDLLDGLSAPVCIIWGDADHAAPSEVIETYRKLAARMSNLELHIFPGIKHGYMMPDAGDAYDQKTREFSLARALAILDDPRGGGDGLRKAS